MNRILVLLSLVLILSGCRKQNAEHITKSPDGQIEVKFILE
ncbi:MAG: lipoprotein, partial [Bacteroidales bacterium]|nr:lipoprotein [Bacteroidales bacterium]